MVPQGRSWPGHIQRYQRNFALVGCRSTKQSRFENTKSEKVEHHCREVDEAAANTTRAPRLEDALRRQTKLLRRRFNVGGAESARQRNDTANHIRHKPRPAAGGAPPLCPRLRLHHATPVPRTTPRKYPGSAPQWPGACWLTTSWPNTTEGSVRDDQGHLYFSVPDGAARP